MLKSSKLIKNFLIIVMIPIERQAPFGDAWLSFVSLERLKATKRRTLRLYDHVKPLSLEDKRIKNSSRLNGFGCRVTWLKWRNGLTKNSFIRERNRFFRRKKLFLFRQIIKLKICLRNRVINAEVPLFWAGHQKFGSKTLSRNGLEVRTSSFNDFEYKFSIKFVQIEMHSQWA